MGERSLYMGDAAGDTKIRLSKRRYSILILEAECCNTRNKISGMKHAHYFLLPSSLINVKFNQYLILKLLKHDLKFYFSWLYI